MSRAYRVSVSESERKIVRGSDHVCTCVELLEILPKQDMATLLSEELLGRGFATEDGKLIRREGDVTISIDPATGEVTVQAAISEEVELTEKVTGWGDEDYGADGRRKVEENLRKRAEEGLQRQAQSKENRLTQQATEQLESVLRDLQPELDGAVNKVTAAALKQKAAQLGEIKEITEDTDNGSMTIVLEV
ncbi:MAG: hypothetical protein NXI04_23175 [Planctomycetaceae bacterium]|nr:hypothetical protein [Planctomycetaceae bacterium]